MALTKLRKAQKHDWEVDTPAICGMIVGVSIPKLSNKQITLNAVLPLKGVTFTDREAMDDAFLPYFAPLQNFFHGEGHRDLVDRLIRCGWITVDRVKGTFTVVLEEGIQVAMQATDPTQGPTPRTVEMSFLEEHQPVTQLTFVQMQMIDEVGKHTSYDPGPNEPKRIAILETLIDAGLVQISYSLTPLGIAEFKKLGSI